MSDRTEASRLARWCSWVFAVLAGALALDGCVSLVMATVPMRVDRTVVFCAVYGFWILWAVIVSIRLRTGAGRIGAWALLLVLGLWLMIGLTLAAAVGVPLKTYHPPVAIWLLHSTVGAAYIGGWISLVRLATHVERPELRLEEESGDVSHGSGSTS